MDPTIQRSQDIHLDYDRNAKEMTRGRHKEYISQIHISGLMRGKQELPAFDITITGKAREAVNTYVKTICYEFQHPELRKSLDMKHAKDDTEAPFFINGTLDILFKQCLRETQKELDAQSDLIESITAATSKAPFKDQELIDAINTLIPQFEREPLALDAEGVEAFGIFYTSMQNISSPEKLASFFGKLELDEAAALIKSVKNEGAYKIKMLEFLLNKGMQYVQKLQEFESQASSHRDAGTLVLKLNLPKEVSLSQQLAPMIGIFRSALLALQAFK